MFSSLSVNPGSEGDGETDQSKEDDGSGGKTFLTVRRCRAPFSSVGTSFCCNTKLWGWQPEALCMSCVGYNSVFVFLTQNGALALASLMNLKAGNSFPRNWKTLMERDVIVKGSIFKFQRTFFTLWTLCSC